MSSADVADSVEAMRAHQPNEANVQIFKDRTQNISRSLRLPGRWPGRFKDGDLARPWHCFKWVNGVHWGLCFSPVDVHNPARYQMEVKQCNLRDAFGCDEDGRPEGITGTVWNAAERGFQTDRCFIVIELMRDIANTFWPCIGTVTEVSVIEHLGSTGVSHTVKGLGVLALEVFNSFLTYGLVGANCQHFARELGRKVGLGKEGMDKLVPNDETTINLAAAVILACAAAVETTLVALPAYTAAQIVAGAVVAGGLGLSVGYGIGKSANRLAQRRRNDQGSSRKHVRKSAFTKRVAKKVRERVRLSSSIGLLS